MFLYCLKDGGKNDRKKKTREKEKMVGSKAQKEEKKRVCI